MPQIFEVYLVHSYEISLNEFDSLLFGHLEVHPSSNGSRGYFSLWSSLTASRPVVQSSKTFLFLSLYNCGLWVITHLASCIKVCLWISVCQNFAMIYPCSGSPARKTSCPAPASRSWAVPWAAGRPPPEEAAAVDSKAPPLAHYFPGLVWASSPGRVRSEAAAVAVV